MRRAWKRIGAILVMCTLNGLVLDHVSHANSGYFIGAITGLSVFLGEWLAESSPRSKYHREGA